jgi:pimeloyl-ACP methyl ester carboxylesterase
MLIRNGRHGYRRRSQAAGCLGKHDLSFDPGEPERYRKDVPNAGVYVLDAGHFALDTRADEIAAPVLEFMKAQK